MLNQIKAVLFDIDGTLFDRDRAQAMIFIEFQKVYAELFESVDDYMLKTVYYEADRLSMEYFYAGGDKSYLREKRFNFFLAMLELDESYAGEMAELYIKLYGGINSSIDGAVEVVTDLKAKYRLGIISNGLGDTQRIKIANLGLIEQFDSIIISQEHGLQKPEAEIFWKCARELNCDPGQCIYIGNSYNGDIIGANGAGMLACWYNPSKTKPLDMPVKPDYEIVRLNELRDILL